MHESAAFEINCLKICNYLQYYAFFPRKLVGLLVSGCISDGYTFFIPGHFCGARISMFTHGSVVGGGYQRKIYCLTQNAAS